MKKQNNITGYEYSDEWYTSEDTARLCYSILDPKPHSTILAPFDTAKSQFVIIGTELGHEMIYGITDFLTSDHYEFDYALTNPPFSVKDAVIRKVYDYAKPTTLILPLDTLGGVRRHQMYKDFGYPEIYIPTRRIGYYDEEWHKRPGANFHSVVMTFNRGYGITWE